MVVEGKLGSFYRSTIPEQNFELVISLSQRLSEGDAKDYLSKLEDQLTDGTLKQLKFSQVNGFFKSEPALGIEVCDRNKEFSGPFSYTLDLPN